MNYNIKEKPDGYHAMTPHLVVKDGMRAIEFYKNVFAAEELNRMEMPDGKLVHAELKIGDSIFMLADECDPHPEHDKRCSHAPSSLKGTTVSLYLYVKNSDEVFNKAIKAGAIQVMPVEDMFWGDRVGLMKDPFGHSWSIATHTRDFSTQKIAREAKHFFTAGE